ncbi:MAG: redox-sensing transcriptional repressor Rex [Gemmataceae bacterium]
MDPRASGERLSRAAAHRLSLYLRVLAAWPAEGGKVSSSRIASACGVTDAQVRRDLAALGSLGQRGIGYEAKELTAAIRGALGIDRTWPAVLVGVGNLARALLRYRGFRAQGFDIVGLFDDDPSKIGQRIEGVIVEPVAGLGDRAAKLGAELAIITVPAEAAQSVTDDLVKAGVRGVLNFAPVLLKLPPKVRLVNVDLAIQLEQLAFLIQLGEANPPDEDA